MRRGKKTVHKEFDDGQSALEKGLIHPTISPHFLAFKACRAACAIFIFSARKPLGPHLGDVGLHEQCETEEGNLLKLDELDGCRMARGRSKSTVPCN